MFSLVTYNPKADMPFVCAYVCNAQGPHIWTTKRETLNIDPLPKSWVTIDTQGKSSVILSLTVCAKASCFSFQFKVEIEENSLNSNLLQLRVIDLDEEFSANWMAVIFFISGNEGNWFDIEMNERTNVGTLRIIKVWYNYPQYFVLLVFLQMLILNLNVKITQTWVGEKIKNYCFKMVYDIELLHGEVFCLYNFMKTGIEF